MKSANAELIDEALVFLGDRLIRDEPMGPHCTYRVGGKAARFVKVRDADELARIAASVSRVGRGEIAVHVVGKGSNLLVADAGLDALVLQLGEEFAGIEVPETPAAEGEERIITVGAAAGLPVVARRTVAAGLGGFEWAVGVPGSIGGAVRMNAGGHGADMSEVLVGIRVIDLATGEDVTMPARDLDLGYRSSAIRASQVVVEADLALFGSDRAVGEEQIAAIVAWRRENQPGGANAGSVFTNPSGDSAGRLIDAAGAKGLRIGTAAVSDKHANFIQADPGGTADDVVRVMFEVVARVASQTGVELHPETVLLGFDAQRISALTGTTSTAGPES